MRTFSKLLPLAVAFVALALVLMQRRTIERLDQALSRRDHAPAAGPSGSSASEDDLASLEQRVAALEQTIARVFRMVLAADQRAPEREMPAPGGAQAVAALREDVDALLTGEAVNTVKGREQLHQIVRQVQDELWQERRQQWTAMRDEMRRSRVAELAKEANLSPVQVEQLNGLLEEEQSQRQALRRAIHEGKVDFAQVRAQMRSLRRATDDKAKSLLDSRQYPAYEKMREERHGPGHGHDDR